MTAGRRRGCGLERGSQESKWPEGATVQLCGVVFGMSDELCKLAMVGEKYAGMPHFLSSELEFGGSKRAHVASPHLSYSFPIQFLTSLSFLPITVAAVLVPCSSGTD
jgi:hypothetical protein